MWTISHKFVTDNSDIQQRNWIFTLWIEVWSIGMEVIWYNHIKLLYRAAHSDYNTFVPNGKKGIISKHVIVDKGLFHLVNNQIGQKLYRNYEVNWNSMKMFRRYCKRNYCLLQVFSFIIFVLYLNGNLDSTYGKLPFLFRIFIHFRAFMLL